MLTETLRRLERAGVLHRCDFSGKVRHVEYHLSPAISAELDVLMDALTRLGQASARLDASGSTH
jgi:DNA-binding HxlR family transcriptional regulator